VRWKETHGKGEKVARRSFGKLKQVWEGFCRGKKCCQLPSVDPEREERTQTRLADEEEGESRRGWRRLRLLVEGVLGVQRRCASRQSGFVTDEDEVGATPSSSSSPSFRPLLFPQNTSDRPPNSHSILTLLRTTTAAHPIMLDRLPVELLDDILELACPPLQLPDYPEKRQDRLTILCSMSLASKLVGSGAQPMLWREPVFGQDVQGAAFVAACKEQRWRGFAKHVRVLHFHGGMSWSVVAALPRKLSTLRRVFSSYLRGEVDLCDFTACIGTYRWLIHVHSI
jgi:hypothetical protein